MRHDAAWLRDYLIAGVEDPRLNVQSILSRHFIIRALFGESEGDWMRQEIGFAAVMNWLVAIAEQAGDGEVLHAVRHALRCRADNAEGVPIPRFVAQAFEQLPVTLAGIVVPNYVESFLAGTRFEQGRPVADRTSLETFQHFYSCWLSRLHAKRPTIIEPACGSANDYRFLDAYGLAPLLDYTGFDLCAKNIQNAKALFPGVRFEIGNAFKIEAPDQSFDLCLVQDLFEHLSLAGLQAAVNEVCRVTRLGICIGFFQMDEIGEHVLRPVEQYHWNLLSVTRMRQLFDSYGFTAQVLHVATFLRQTVGCGQTHNPNAYSFFLRRRISIADQSSKLG
jgi:SAM-dependent methyltransferase